MTGSPEKGQGPVTDDIRREAQRTGRDPCTILKERLQAARSQRPQNPRSIRELIKAEKYFGCRNKQKR